MAEENMLISVDTKTLCQMTGISRQRLHELRWDPASGFPEPCKIGRALRWIVSEVLQWLQATKASNTEDLRNLSAKNVALHGRKSQQKAAKPRHSLSLKMRAKPSMAEVQQANDRVLSSRLMPGQYRFARMVETTGGEKIMSHTVGRVKAPKVFAPPKSVEIRNHRSQWVNGKLIPFPAETDWSPLTEPAVSVAPLDVPIPELSLAQLKSEYEESGLSLDAICRRYRIGRSRALKLLREAGTKMRAPGRKSRAAPLSIAAHQR